MKVYLHESGRSIRRYSGAALVITLAMLILVSFVVVAFLGRSTREAVLVGGAVGGQKADLLANSVSELIIADLKNEMRAGSTETVIDEIAIMEPTSAATAFPSQNRLAATTGTSYVNVLKQSGATGGMFTASGTKLISDNTTTQTTTASVDGRKISEDRWNAPQLLVGGSFSTSQVPNWILMDRVGIAPSQSWNNTFKDRTPTNDSYIIGRFAYNIYDVSGLLDVNVAGCPSSVSGVEIGKKGSLGLAVVSNNIPTITQYQTEFVSDWRNRVTGSSEVNFLSFLGLGSAVTNHYYNLGPKYGFQKVVISGSDSDNSILSRQDLIRLANNGGFGITSNSLPYLTHVSREVNSPSFAAANSIRVSSSFIRRDGTDAIKGELLLRRFPISSLAWIGPAGVLSPGAANDVKRDFGLIWNTDHWDYVGTGSSRLSSIGSISGSREPNFFELIQLACPSYNIQQILTIGACIIDQYDSDSITTRIDYSGTIMPPSTTNSIAWGMENSATPTPPEAPVPPAGTVILNREFRNAGDFGYAYRHITTPETSPPSTPKTLDFSTSGSPDSQILDLFGPSNTPIRAGVVNLNTPHKEVLKACLSGALKAAPSTNLSNSDADTYASLIITTTSSSKANGLSDLSRIAASVSGIEEGKETVARVLSGFGNTRTWNVMVDLVVQSGRYANAATAVDKFTVDGERRMWVHLAIDRYTGQVIARSTEIVNE
jgi:hypothetical protein